MTTPARSAVAMTTILCALRLAGCSAADGIGISGVYGYAPVTPRGSAVAYLVIENNTSSELRISAARSPAFALVQFHESVERNERMYMQPLQALSIKPGEILDFRPGGKHLMLMSPHRDIPPGWRSKIIIEFDNGRTVTAPLTFHDRAAPPPESS